MSSVATTFLSSLIFSQKTESNHTRKLYCHTVLQNRKIKNINSRDRPGPLGCYTDLAMIHYLQQTLTKYLILQGIVSIHRMTEHRDLEGIHKDHRVQTLAPPSNIPNSNPMSESAVQSPLNSSSLGCAHCPRSLCYAHSPLVQNHFLTPSPTLS